MGIGSMLRAIALWCCGIFCVGAADGLPDDWNQRLEYAQSYDARMNGRVYRTDFKLNFFGEQDQYAWYRVDTGPEAHEYVLVDTTMRRRSPAFDHQWLAEQLQTALVDAEASLTIAPERLELGTLRFAPDATTVDFRFAKRRWRIDRVEQKLSEINEGGEMEEDPLAFGLQPMAYLERSTSSGDATRIAIKNETEETLTVYWHDPSGENRHYGEIEPQGTFESSTYSGHVWLLVGAEEKWIAAFRADPFETQATVSPATRAPQPAQRGRRRGQSRNPSTASDRQSADGAWTVEFRQHNVVLRSATTGHEYPLTGDGTELDGFGGRVWWSPDSKHFIILRTKKAEQRMITIVESSPRDQLQPKVLTVPYTKPGDSLDHPRPYLFHVPDDELSAESLQRCQGQAIDDSLFPNPFEINHFRWRADSTAFTFVYNQRGHQTLRVLALDPLTAEVRALIDETSSTFVCYSHKFFYEYLEGTNEILWMTERDGWNHIVCVDAQSGQVKHAVTKGEWVVREVVRVDLAKRQLWLAVGGLVSEEDPYHQHLVRVNFDGTELTRLTDGDGTHDWQFSPTDRWVIDTYSRVDLAPVRTLRDAATGELICELERGDWSELAAQGWQPPERFVAKGRDGVTDIHGIIIRPTDFDPEKKLQYPILEAIYAGPQDAFTPKTFGRHGGLYEMAELGFIVVKLDGMGTSQRSKAFHDVCWQNLGDSGFPDRILWIQAAAKKYAEMDLGRIGIWGGSAGGQSALRALLAHGDFYHAAAADCGCHDNRMDKIWWNEQWMGYPIGPHYEEQSNVTQAHRLQGKLLLTVGELDTNVDPASTMQVANALIAAGKPFELIVFPGAGHGAGSSPYGVRRMMEFFVRALGDPAPQVVDQ